MDRVKEITGRKCSDVKSKRQRLYLSSLTTRRDDRTEEGDTPPVIYYQEWERDKKKNKCKSRLGYVGARKNIKPTVFVHICSSEEAIGKVGVRVIYAFHC